MEGSDYAKTGYRWRKEQMQRFLGWEGAWCVPVPNNSWSINEGSGKGQNMVLEIRTGVRSFRVLQAVVKGLYLGGVIVSF